MIYDKFLEQKRVDSDLYPISHGKLAGHLFDHQRHIVKWALGVGRAAVFADTGLGKTAIQIEWARHASKHGRVLILAPLAVAQQTVAEAKRFGVDVVYARSDSDAPITITNYEMLEHFDPAAFVAVVLDESSIIKSYTGSIRTKIIESFSRTRWRLACTATPSPNDYTELGNHAEFLGVKTRTEMLAEYFVHDLQITHDWRLKGHAIKDFWRWVSTWAIVMRKPSDLGYDDARFELPPLSYHNHMIVNPLDDPQSSGMLFKPPSATLSDQRQSRRTTIDQRVEKIQEIIASHDRQVLIWCEFNAEGDSIANAISAIQVAGSDSIDDKTARIAGFIRGDYRILVSKAKIMGFGINAQNCSDMIFIGVSHSFEQTYQAIRRCWRFGQTREVNVHYIMSPDDALVVKNYKEKETAHNAMSIEMVNAMRGFNGVTVKHRNEYKPSKGIRVPSWVA